MGAPVRVASCAIKSMLLFAGFAIASLTYTVNNVSHLEAVLNNKQPPLAAFLPEHAGKYQLTFQCALNEQSNDLLLLQINGIDETEAHSA